MTSLILVAGHGGNGKREDGEAIREGKNGGSKWESAWEAVVSFRGAGSVPPFSLLMARLPRLR